MNKSIKWTFNLSVKSVLMIIAGALINMSGKWIASMLVIPFWLDTTGTMLVAILYGPIAGAISGLLSNGVYAVIYDPLSLPYMLVSVVIAITVGFLYPRNRDTFQVVFTAMVVGFFSALVSAPLNMFLYDGYVGNTWGNALIDMLDSQNISRTISCFLGEVFIDIPDKVVCLLLIAAILWVVSKKTVKEEVAKDEK